MIKGIVAVVFALGVVSAGVSAGANPPEPSKHLVHVVKVVEGAPGDVSGVIDVCGQSVNWDEDGADQTVEIGDYFDGDQTCEISEPDDGGASSVEISPNVCEFTGRSESLTDETKEYPDQVCEVVVENSFDEVTTTTAAPAPPVVIEQPPVVIQANPAPVVVSSPRFTG